MSKEIDEIRRRAGITEAGAKPYSTTDKGTAQIYHNILNAMQEAEEMGGPEGEEYVRMMNAIAQEATKRARTAQANYDEDQTSQAMSRILRPPQ